jgi:hypothetical protein
MASDVDAVIEAKGLKQMNDSGALEKIIDEVIAANPDNVEQFKAGKDKAFNALVGRGQGQPAAGHEASPGQGQPAGEAGQRRGLFPTAMKRCTARLCSLSSICRRSSAGARDGSFL